MQCGKSCLWGFEVELGMQSYAWTKLLLDKSLQHSEFNDEILEKITGSRILKRPNQKEAVDTVADYLSRIYAYIQQHIPKLYRDGVLICDCGGGTVVRDTPLHSWHFISSHRGQDIATYYVTDVDPTTRLEQITTATGAKCGGTAIDSRFYNPRRGYFSLQSEDIRGLYEPVLSRIFALIGSQVMAANEKCGRDVINKVILVGGFSASPFLQDRLQHALEPFPNISVLVAKKP
ncbi:unnamed protein product [Penicillium glandicola]